MEGRRNPFVAPEGLPLLGLLVVAIGFALHADKYLLTLFLLVLLTALYLLFRDPSRVIPAAPLGVVSPVDGTVTAIEPITDGLLHADAWRLRIEIDAFGAYAARSPVEGKIMNLDSVENAAQRGYETNALWVQTDEGDDVVLQFTHYRLGLAPRAIVRYGERIGQGKRCAYLRLTRFAEVYIDATSTVLVEPGQVVVAGSDLLAKLHSA